ncbi:SAM-dependent chlorinase/fluorinase [Candidatus Beckwithbacteria bacterium]|nr:SAM-dependent chlorinase/fluorinase [Candidatus Beckwithbacteria bacterium]
MSIFLHLVADYGKNDPAFNEVKQRLLYHYPEFVISETSVPAFNTISTGFWIYQYAMGQHPEKMMIYSNTAPRKDNKKERKENAGEHFIYAKLENGVKILAVNSGFTFSFIKPYIKELKAINIPNQGSQFRSRDFYPLAAGKIVKGENDILGIDLNPEEIPAIPTNRIAWVDGYGNIKTTMRKSQITYEQGSKVQVIIDGVIRTALVSGGSFSVSEGELALSFGSSGYEDPFVEVFLRGGDAYTHFNNPSWYADIKIQSFIS